LTKEDFMKLVLAWLTGLNICVCGATFLAVALENSKKDSQFDTGLARAAVRGQLEELASVSGDGTVRLTKGCAETKENGGVIIGTGEASSQSGVISGVPVNEASRFSYSANVSASCDQYNLNCYKVNKIDVAGSRSIRPRL
jgi:hypothetical protein